ncbi:SGNH/GDSL hydrolase family protein [Anabaena sp. UHCC 0399]|uniref:SGNH/GDSL hydrolase family protein n=1 Tax=Anabaena sp. UHCC 0399 TaxID=3110238 RepID=UPI002B2004A8|nr:SGNH/GDSL hydrolase family protein [Anabaena sp. UHCC 0399]MEA5565242.1 SGNH/GDSL hydrolase family protein [Anabaena sp. UHCC 0399]
MRDSYLLAAGLLTGLAIPASAIPEMSILLPEKHSSQWNAKQDSQTIADDKHLLKRDISTPEFSSQVSQPGENLHPPLEKKFFLERLNLFLPELSSQLLASSEASEPRANEKKFSTGDVTSPQFTNQEVPISIESLFNPSNQPTDALLTSGNQLYYQRLAALKTGQIYTRADIDNFQGLGESRGKQQLTYEDWKSLLALEAKAIAQGQGKNRLSILVGDSLSLWFPRQNLPTGKLWLNQGISGDTSGGIATRLASFAQTRPDAIYIMAGINDLRKGTSDETILRNHRRMMRSLRKNHPKAQIFVQSILPAHVATISNSRIRHLNTRIAQIAKQEGVNYLNIHNWFTDADGNLRSDLTTDGIHLSPDGYDIWRFALQQVEFKLSQTRN